MIWESGKFRTFRIADAIDGYTDLKTVWIQL